MKLAVLTGGGPAPGMNGVIQAVTVAARRRGWSVLGVPHGFSRLMRGDAEARGLCEEDVQGIETRGGSILFTSRANPTKDPDDLARVVAAMKDLGVDALVTIGGDDTATSAARVAEAAGGIRVAHVPKTIDNDLPLPGDAPTFGFDTARHLGASLCRNLREDARTTGRWYLVSAMGRSAGHLALGMAVGSGADLVAIPEEFAEKDVPFNDVVDLVDAAVAKRRSEGQDWGLAVLGEGILDRLRPEDLERIATLETDEHGNPRMSEVDLGAAVRDALGERLRGRGRRLAFVTKLIGYELRSADPTAFDIQYTRTLGAGAVAFLADGDGDAVISLQGGAWVPLRFGDLRDAAGRVRVRRVDLDGASWQAALALQARLDPGDLEGERLGRLAEAAGLSPEDCRRAFGRLVGLVAA